VGDKNWRLFLKMSLAEETSAVQIKVYKYISLGMIKTATFIASKLYYATGKSSAAKLVYLHCLLLSGEAKRANSFYQLRNGENIDSFNKLDRIFFLRSVLSQQEWKQPSNSEKDSTLESFLARKLEDRGNSRDQQQGNLFQVRLDNFPLIQMEENSPEVEATYCYLQGKAALQLLRKEEAAQLFQKALEYDCFCVEAILALSESELLTEAEKKELIFNTHLFRNESWLQLFYAALLNCSLLVFHQLVSSIQNVSTSDKDSKQLYLFVDSMPSVLEHCHSSFFCKENLKNLASDTDFLMMIAGFLYSQKRYSQCSQVLDKILNQDKYFLSVYIWKSACLYALGKANELFRLAHWLVREFPESEVSWYAVGCYYLSCKQYFQARQYFQKATSLRPSWSLSWIALGHTFAFQDESDQALAAYRTVYRLSSNCFDSVLFMAVEYLRQNNYSQAQRLLEQALNITATEPQPFHELGILYYRQENFSCAIDCFQRSLQLAKGMIGEIPHAFAELSGYFCILTASLLGLGHCYRRQGLYSKALDTLEEALAIEPQDPSICSAIGLTYHSQCKYENAIEMYHRCMAIRGSDLLVESLLELNLKSMASSCPYN